MVTGNIKITRLEKQTQSLSVSNLKRDALRDPAQNFKTMSHYLIWVKLREI